jgi:pimeloyl-ACP methyl ester carboxylesterase
MAQAMARMIEIRLNLPSFIYLPFAGFLSREFKCTLGHSTTKRDTICFFDQVFLMPFVSQYLTCNDQTIHCKTAGPSGAPVMLMLHGFPEYWAAWAEVAALLSNDYRVVLPDQRGFNLSSKPSGVESYDTKHLVADMVSLIDQISPDRQIILCGHDWGAAVAYAMAMGYGNRISRLVIANGVHPFCFQKALFAGGAQTAASQYVNVLRGKGIEERLAADNYEKLLGMLKKFSSARWMSKEVADGYRQAWSQAGGLEAMVNWYRASPMVVPEPDAPAVLLEVTGEVKTKYHIAMPHLLLWGRDDTALVEETRRDLPAFCADLEVHEADNASHWILHEKPDWVAEKIAAFVG